MPVDKELNPLIIGALAILVAAIALSVGIQINDDLQQDFTNNTAMSRFNDTFTASNSSRANSTLGSPLVSSGSLTVYLSNSSNKQIALGNFTIDYALGTIGLVSADPSGFNGSGMNANYQYSTHSPAWNVTRNSSLGMGEMSSWFVTISLVLAAGIVISFLMYAFASRKKNL